MNKLFIHLKKLIKSAILFFSQENCETMFTRPFSNKYHQYYDKNSALFMH